MKYIINKLFYKINADGQRSTEHTYYVDTFTMLYANETLYN